MLRQRLAGSYVNCAYSKRLHFNPCSVVSIKSYTVYSYAIIDDKLFWIQETDPFNTYFNKLKVASSKQVNGLHSNLVHACSFILGLGVYQESI